MTKKTCIADLQQIGTDTIDGVKNGTCDLAKAAVLASLLERQGSMMKLAVKVAHSKAALAAVGVDAHEMIHGKPAA